MIKTKIGADDKMFEEELFAAILELKYREKNLSSIDSEKDTCNSINLLH